VLWRPRLSGGRGADGTPVRTPAAPALRPPFGVRRWASCLTNQHTLREPMMTSDAGPSGTGGVLRSLWGPDGVISTTDNRPGSSSPVVPDCDGSASTPPRSAHPVEVRRPNTYGPSSPDGRSHSSPRLAGRTATATANPSATRRRRRRRRTPTSSWSPSPTVSGVRRVVANRPGCHEPSVTQTSSMVLT
jgi:hypothetical protein